MRKHKVHIVRAFTANGRGGNPAGVALHADHLSQQQKQHIAREAGLSETAFVSHSEKADVRVEFFTPNRQIAHCGHATIATFGYLARKGLIRGESALKESVEDIRPIRFEDSRIFLGQRTPAFHGQDAALTDKALAALGLDFEAILPGQRAEIVSTGVDFLLVPLKDEMALEAIRPRFLEIEALSEDLGLIGFYAFHPSKPGENHHAVARMFGPRFGITEESATGMAAGPLACFLYWRMGIRDSPILIHQGLHLVPPSPSELEVQLTTIDGQLDEVWVGGEAVWQEDRLVEVESHAAACCG